MNRLSAVSSDASRQFTQSSASLSSAEHKRSSRRKRNKGPVEFNAREWEQDCERVFENTIEPRMNHSVEDARYLLQNMELGLLNTAQGNWGQQPEKKRDLQAAREIVMRLGAEYLKNYRQGGPAALTRSIAESSRQQKQAAPPAFSPMQVNRQQHTGSHNAGTGIPFTAQSEPPLTATTFTTPSSHGNRPARSDRSAHIGRTFYTTVDYDQTWWEERCRKIYSETLKPAAYDKRPISAELHGFLLDEAEQGLRVLASGKSGAVMHGYASLAVNDSTACYNKVLQQMLDLAHELRKDYELPQQGPRRSTISLGTSGQGHLHNVQSQLRGSPSEGPGTGTRHSQPAPNTTRASATISDKPVQDRRNRGENVAKTQQPATRRTLSSRSNHPSPCSTNEVDIYYQINCLSSQFNERLGRKEPLRLDTLNEEWTYLLEAVVQLIARLPRTGRRPASEREAIQSMKEHAQVYLRHLERVVDTETAYCMQQMDRVVKAYNRAELRTHFAVQGQLQWLDKRYLSLRTKLTPHRSMRHSSSWRPIAALRDQMRANLRTAYEGARGKFELEWRQLHMYSNKRGLLKVATNKWRTEHSSRAFKRYESKTGRITALVQRISMAISSGQ